MPELVELIAPQGKIKTSIDLPVSKSMCNRALVLMAATNGMVEPDILSDADDTRLLQAALIEKSEQINVGAGGTTLRFLLPILAATPGYSGIVKGSERLMNRPVNGLIEALNSIGARVEQNSEGIRIEGRKLAGGKLKLPKSETSQFASALLLASPMFEQGLELDTGAEMVSPTYFNMTVKMMQRAGFKLDQSGTSVTLNPQFPGPAVLEMEKDWSAASYWYGFAALRPGSEIMLRGLKSDSVQGDALCSAIFGLFGVHSQENQTGMLVSSGESRDFEFGMDVWDVPDLFQTLAFTLAGLGKKFILNGLSTLRVKETDRIEAVCSQLKKVRVSSSFAADDVLVFDARDLKTEGTVIFESFEDHRMAMSAAVLSTVLWRAAVRDPYVVSKSYPSFWKDLANAGFSVRELES